MVSTARLEVRVRPTDKARLERAAALEQVPVSEFVRSAVEDRTERVLKEHESRTVVPTQFFDQLLAALDAPAAANTALAGAAIRARELATG
jgi:uncharacterized protein (DUF1778 family)